MNRDRHEFGPYRNNTTGLRGVRHIRRFGFTAWIGDRYLGYFKDPRLAALAYDQAALEEYGEEAWLNFEPDDWRPGDDEQISITR